MPNRAAPEALGLKTPVPASSDAPGWVHDSRLLADAYALAKSAHGGGRRASDERYFLEHVVEVAELLRDAGFDDELIAVGLLHDTVERGALSEDELRSAMGASISSLVLALGEDPQIASFERRKAGLRRQVETAGPSAVTVYAADKLSAIRGLRRGIERYRTGLEARLGASLPSMTDHYRESVRMIEAVLPASTFLPALRAELERLEVDVLGEPDAG